MTKEKFERLMVQKKNIKLQIRRHRGIPNMELVTKELNDALNEVELDLLQLVPKSIDKSIVDALNATILYTSVKPRGKQLARLYNLISRDQFVSIRTLADKQYPNRFYL